MPGSLLLLLSPADWGVRGSLRTVPSPLLVEVAEGAGLHARDRVECLLPPPSPHFPLALGVPAAGSSCIECCTGWVQIPQWVIARDPGFL